MHILLHTYVQASWKEKVVSRKELRLYLGKGRLYLGKRRLYLGKKRLLNLKRGSGISEP